MPATDASVRRVDGLRQWRTFGVGLIGVCVELQQRLHRRHVPARRGGGERGDAVVVLGLHRGAVLEQNRDGRRVALQRRNVQARAPVFKLLAHLRPGLDQRPH